MRKIKCWNYVKAVMVFITAGLLVYACKRDYDATEFERPKGNKELSPSVARQWFERKYSPIVELRFGNRPSGGLDLRSSSGNTNSKVSESGILIKPNWEKTTEGRKKDIEVVEISAMTNKRLFFMDEETRDRRSPSDGKSMRNTARVVIHKDLETGKTRSFLMVFVGTYDYLKSGNNIAKNSYFKRDPNFEGDVMFYNLDGSLINGWRYRNKKIVARITPTHLSSNALNKRMQAGNARMSGGYWDCWDEPFYYEEEVCVQEGSEVWDAELGWGSGVDYSCHTETRLGYREVCNWVNGPYNDDEPYYPTPKPNPDTNPSNPNPDPGYVDPEPEPQQTPVGDREPTSYIWRDKLTADIGAHLEKTTPLFYRGPNGDLIASPFAFNCHYHTFHLSDPSAFHKTAIDIGAPMWVDEINLKNWDRVTTGIQIGDVVLYNGLYINADGDILGNGLQHSGIVTQVDTEGYAIEIESKMAEYEIIRHHPRDVPASYGTTDPTYEYNGVTYDSRIYYRKK